jgi:hypothetical protein
LVPVAAGWVSSYLETRNQLDSSAIPRCAHM